MGKRNRAISFIKKEIDKCVLDIKFFEDNKDFLKSVSNYIQDKEILERHIQNKETLEYLLGMLEEEKKEYSFNDYQESARRTRPDDNIIKGEAIQNIFEHSLRSTKTDQIKALVLEDIQEAVERLHLSIGALGLTGEAGEVADEIKKVLGHGHKLDKRKLIKELGDVLWYISYLSDTLGISLETIGKENIKKLKERYPSTFSTERSINRNED